MSSTTEGRELAPDPGRVENPTVTVASGGQGRASGGMRYDVTEFGYEEREYFFSGTAKTYPPADLEPARYRSRMIVWTPRDPADFNGTVVVEWAQVSDFGHFELTVDINQQSAMLIDGGYAFVLVSAEEGGVCDRGSEGCSPSSLEGADPERYETLVHPGDPYSFDIFSQALQAIKYPSKVAPLAPLQPSEVLVEGFQSSIDKWYPTGHPDPNSYTGPFSLYGSLNAYIANGADAEAELADGFLIDGAAPASEPARRRVPALHVLDESAIRRSPTPDRTNHVTWEVVGAPHADRWSGSHYITPSAEGSEQLTKREELAKRATLTNYGQRPDPSAQVCAPGPRSGSLFPRRYAINAGLAALREWVTTGDAAPPAPRIERVGPPPTSASNKLRRDAEGNAIGGLRLPIITVPVASYNGEACVQAGTTTPFAAERLGRLYPTHERYVSELRDAVNEAVRDRYLICRDAEALLAEASRSTIGGSDPATARAGCARDGADG